MTYPSSAGLFTGSTFMTGFDAMGRATGLTESQPGWGSTVTWVSGLQYNAAGQMTQFVYGGAGGVTETRQYNPLSQLTRITVQGGSTYADLEYRYSSTQNNGRITQLKNWVSGEEVNYQYDALQRLSSAATTGPEWGLNFSYDGFGTRRAKR